MILGSSGSFERILNKSRSRSLETFGGGTRVTQRTPQVDAALVFILESCSYEVSFICYLLQYHIFTTKDSVSQEYSDLSNFENLSARIFSKSTSDIFIYFVRQCSFVLNGTCCNKDEIRSCFSEWRSSGKTGSTPNLARLESSEVARYTRSQMLELRSAPGRLDAKTTKTVNELEIMRP